MRIRIEAQNPIHEQCGRCAGKSPKCPMYGVLIKSVNRNMRRVCKKRITRLARKASNAN